LTTTNPPAPVGADCAFCAIVDGRAPATIVREWPEAIAIRPRRGGVAEGHVLVLPRVHVQDAGVDPTVTAAVMARVAELMADLDAANMVSSKGSASSQTVFHMHVHVVPRVDGDGLQLPWTPQQDAARAAREVGRG
jgi:histidine triad (HIT) family protein